MKNFCFGILAATVGTVIFGYLFVYLGGIPMDTKSGALPGEMFLARTALRAAIKSEIGRQSSVAADENTWRAGARIYKTNCRVCHGSPGLPETPIAKGMFPPPPQLMKDGVEDDPVGETFWKIKNGIRLTGMPGFGGALSETELWQVSQFLVKGGGKLPSAILDSLRARD